jgi:hypothetical protein
MTVAKERWKTLSVEGLLIVFSILLAFMINAWWDTVQDERRAQELVESMISDFETTRERIAASAEEGNAILRRGEILLNLIRSGEEVPVDSLRFLIEGMTMGIVFQPAISSYRGAESSGDLALLDHPSLYEALANFDLTLQELSRQRQINSDILYSGAQFGLRNEVGSIEALGLDPPKGFGVVEFTDSEYRAFLRQPRVYSVIETDYLGNRGMLIGLQIADQNVTDILDELRVTLKN